MEIRTLREGDREALFALLDLWDLGEPLPGREFFRRYVEDDPTFEDHNYWLAVEDGTPVSCVQIFPRPLRTAAGRVWMGGIGSVFTHPAHRKRGHGEALLARACEAMRERDMPISMLFAARIPWYTKLGWRSLGVSRTLLRRAPRASADPGAVETFQAERDLAGVVALYEAYCASRPGTVVRDARLWEASLANAGNPGEEFLLARTAGAPCAYARAAVVSGFLSITEFAHAPGAEAELAVLFASLLTPRSNDPLALPDRPSDALRGAAATVSLDGEPDLRAVLDAQGFALAGAHDPTLMLRCLDAEALETQAGTRRAPGETPSAFLGRVLPAESFSFWPADRF